VTTTQEATLARLAVAPSGTARLLPTDETAAPRTPRTAAQLRTPAALISDIDAAGLLGRGGGGFPTARKLLAVAQHTHRGRRAAVVVANCCEGDPSSAKDRVLTARSPHLIIDGALAAAAAVGADRIVLAAHRGSSAVAQLTAALSRTHTEIAEIEVCEIPARFVASEASAVVNFVNTGDARPTGKLNPVWKKGIDARPTLVGNAETLAHLGMIASFGPDWYRSVGTAVEPGTTLMTITGAVGRPGVLEVAHGVAITAILRATNAQAAKWALVGGLAGRWVTLHALSRSGFSTTALTEAGAVRGVSSITVLPAEDCVLNETSRILSYLARSGAGQCGPCMFGLPAIAADMAALNNGDHEALRRLRRRLPVIDHRGGCSHPDGAVAMTVNALAVLTGPETTHLTEHLEGRRCAPSAKFLPDLHPAAAS